MDNFKNVDVDILANIYFESKVISKNIFKKLVQKNIRGYVAW